MTVQRLGYQQQLIGMSLIEEWFLILEDVEKGKHPTLLVEMKVGATTMETNVEVPQKAKSRTNI